MVNGFIVSRSHSNLMPEHLPNFSWNECIHSYPDEHGTEILSAPVELIYHSAAGDYNVKQSYKKVLQQIKFDFRFWKYLKNVSGSFKSVSHMWKNAANRIN